MELIVLFALVACGLVLRKQHQRIKTLERDFSALRASLPTASLPSEVPQTEADAERIVGQADPAAHVSDPEPEDIDEEVAASGPWAQAARVGDDAPAQPEEPAGERTEPRPARDFETAIGSRWAVWVGGLALALGGVFLVRYSIEAGIFGPQVRLAGAILFGLLLAAAGELARRRGFRAPVAGVSGAYVPAILTAASAFTLFAAIYAAHAIYGFVGPTTGFILLAAVALATIGAALIHGQALAGLGLLGSYLTPVLVASEAPSAWTFFLYLAIVQVAAMAIAAHRRWRFLAAAAIVGAGLWSLAYLVDSFTLDPAPVAVSLLAGLAALALLWLSRPGTGEKFIDPASTAAGVFVFLIALFLARGVALSTVNAGPWASALIIASLVVVAWRDRALPLLHAAGLATLVITLWPLLGGNVDIDLLYGGLVFDGVWLQPGPDTFLSHSLLLAGVFLVAGVVMALRKAAMSPRTAALWAFWASLLPLLVLATAWLSIGNLDVDWRFACAAFVLAVVLSGTAELVARSERPQQAGGWAVTFFAGGAALAFCFAVMTAFGPLLTTILTGLSAALPAATTRLLRWPALGWIAAGIAALTLARIAVDPTVVGQDFLTVTPILNALSPAYLLPALACAYAAWQLHRTADGRARLAMEAFAGLFALLGAAMLVRHAMNGGVIDAAEPTLAEQAIYTLIMIGGGAILLALDNRSPSPVFRWGSIGLGVLSVLAIASAHFIALNPLFTNESTGTIPVINLLLLAYLMPAVAMAALAWRARGRRPQWYVALLAAGAAALAFAYVSFSVRRVFQGEFIGAWKGMEGLETYTYSAVWLALGVGVLAAGLRFDLRVLRLGSAVLVVAAVAKVFLYDMRELEGVLRAVSFMGLGAVLIGIGMFYQRMLAGARKEA
ncbi:DUF2339 domain-containing protein [Mesorhizobium sp. CAU 1741]|uniref:DUF2339 domain-containing protein n=1 Tax=Mesorhizobium sp. CAU 1741 TaxID=3140366 RepID=UPI00325A8D48